MPPFPLSLAHPWLCLAAAVAALAAAAIVLFRRPAVHRMTVILAGIALPLFVLAAGGLTWQRPAASRVVVMVDLSASTRGAEYRDRGKLDARIRELLGTMSFQTIYFSDHNAPQAAGGKILEDLAGDRTVFSPPASAAILLFSDGRFALPSASPPVFAVTDPALDLPNDAAVTRLEAHRNQIAATVRQSGPPRRLTLDAAATRPTSIVDSGPLTIARTIKPKATIATARFNGGDLWPENDALSLPLSPLMRTQRWFVSTGRAPAGDWRLIAPDQLSTQSSDYLSPGVIVLDNLPAASLSGAQQAALEQYVRDLGGALIIGGGDRAFSEGVYPGSALESLSPLASSPPAPAVHWMLLADSSGSMSQAFGDTTRWRLAAFAIASLLPHLPADDPVSVGSFSAELNWWSSGRSARETAGLTLPPANVTPGGPTNLEAALDRIAREASGGLIGELLVVSDADTTFEHPDELARRLTAKKIRLHVLAIGEGSALPILQKLTTSTGGTLRRQLDPARWAKDVRQLLSAAYPKRLMKQPAAARFVDDLGGLRERAVTPWNRTWLKKSAGMLARTTLEDEIVPLAGRWDVGNGAVIASAFSPDSAELEAMARLIGRPPRDPRFVVTWDAGSQLRVRVDAGRGGKYFNDLTLRLEISDEAGAAPVRTSDIPQIAPGRYEAAVGAPRERSFAAVWNGRQLVDRIALPARYAAEFDAVGNDYDALRSLALQTGGKVIDHTWTKPIDIAFPRWAITLAPWLALAAGILLAAALARWRYG